MSIEEVTGTAYTEERSLLFPFYTYGMIIVGHENELSSDYIEAE